MRGGSGRDRPTRAAEWSGEQSRRPDAGARSAPGDAGSRPQRGWEIRDAATARASRGAWTPERPAGRGAGPAGSGAGPTGGSRDERPPRAEAPTRGAGPRTGSGSQGDRVAPTGVRRGPEGARRGGSSTGGPARAAGRSGAGARREEVEARAYDPRREARRQLIRVPLPDDVDPRALDQEVRQDLRGLGKDTADLTAQHLIMTGRLLDEDPQAALAHARAAGALAGRIGAVREAVGLAAYAAQEWADALSELRAARRITGRAEHLAVVADCERALGRPERALTVLSDAEVPKLEQAARVELVIVVAGARRDLGQPHAAVLLLQGPARATTARRPWATRLWYAYADALLAAGREDEAREWFAKAAEQDGQGETDAMERLLELDGVVLQDLQESEDDDDEEPEAEPVDLQALLREPVAHPAQTHARPDGGEPQQLADDAVTAEPGPPPAAAAATGQADGPTAEPAPGLFSDEEPVAAAEPASTRPPVVPFTPPAVSGDDRDAPRPR